MAPALLLGILVVLILSQLLYAVGRWRAAYPAVLVLTAAGIGAGQLWRAAGLPGAGIGELNLLPGVVFAMALRPLAPRMPLPRLPRLPRRGDGRPGDG